MNIRSSINTLVVGAVADKDDIRNLLKNDHDEALEIAKEMHETDDAARRAALIAKLTPALVAHSRAEEDEVYDPLIALKKSAEARGIGNEGYVEHGMLDGLLDGLGKLDASDADKWKAKAKVLFELLQHHVEEEHDVMFRQLTEHFTAEQLVAMGKAFTAAKQHAVQKRAAA
jgi:hemerythrin superfamily protein